MRAAGARASVRFAQYLLAYHQATAPRVTGIFADDTFIRRDKLSTSIRPTLIRQHAARMFADREQTIFGGEPPGRKELLQQYCREEYRELKPKIISG